MWHSPAVLGPGVLMVMNRSHASLMAALLAASALTAEAGRSTVTSVTPDPLQSMVRLALADAARRAPRDATTLKVASAETVTWPDGAIGCAQPGMQYTQALVPGFRIRIQAGAQILEYHAGPRGQPIYCPAERVSEPATVDPRT